MTERPILFSGAMVRAVLRGQKTQTRRPVMPQPVIHPDAPKPFGEWTHKGQKIQCGPGAFPTLHFARHCPFGQPGDRLWVRETWNLADPNADDALSDDVYGPYAPFTGSDGARKIHWRAIYRASCPASHPKYGKALWKPSIHMPRWASRITLQITHIRVERVQDINALEAIAEEAREVHKVGDDPSHPTWSMGDTERYDSAREAFAAAWDSIYAKRGLGWGANPWVLVVKFKRVEERCKK